MKILFSQIKEFVPKLKAAPKEVGERLTYLGFMMSSLTSVKYLGKQDWLMDLEVRQNRADCYSVLGVAREVASAYGLEIKLPKVKPPKAKPVMTRVKVSSPKAVRRIMATEFDNVSNGDSPKWLKDWLAFYDLPDVNVLVDLTNYVMMLTGYPSHVLDADKINGPVTWSLNQPNFKSITTLNGQEIKLKGGELLIHDDRNPLSTSLVGGRAAEAGKSTTHAFLEIAVYDPAVIRKNSRELDIATEASKFLTKDLDTEGLKYAADLLFSMAAELSKGEMRKIYEFYPVKRKMQAINFEPSLAERLAGIEITPQEAARNLKRLRFTGQMTGKVWKVIPPPDRTDVFSPEDVAEEVIRLTDFRKIPSNLAPAWPPVKDITPRRVRLCDRFRNILSDNGYDEIISLPMVASDWNKETNYLGWQEIIAENAINEEYPALRESLIYGLLAQAESYRLKNLDHLKIFELGRTFGKINGSFSEKESLALLAHESGVADPTGETERMARDLLGKIGLKEISVEIARRAPNLAKENTSKDLLVRGEWIGILYTIKPQKLTGNLDLGQTAVAEIDLDALTELLGNDKEKAATQLTQKLVVLDGNMEVPNGVSLASRVKDLRGRLGEKNLWSLEIKDKFVKDGVTRYTVRVSYFGLNDLEAKQLHQRIFG